MEVTLFSCLPGYQILAARARRQLVHANTKIRSRAKLRVLRLNESIIMRFYSFKVARVPR